MKLISNNRIIPTAVLVGACFAFTGAALGSTAAASSTTAVSSASAAAGPVVVRCNGLVVTDKVPANFVGIFVPANPSANNVILGRGIRDVIKAGSGNDTICSLGGDDEIWGEGGNDTFFSGNENDRNLGGGGIDSFDCGSGSSDVANGGGEVGDFARANCESQFDIPA
jgi:Ca2+-binding RTX toxin-like protein